MTRALPITSFSADDLRPLRVLVVDDNLGVQGLLRDVLQAAGVGAVETARDGLEARQVIARWNPDLIFSDWAMPRMDGLELTRSIRRAAVKPDPYIRSPQTPVILVTGKCSAADVETARLAGVNEFVLKPFTPAALISRIQLALTKPRPFVIGADYVGPDRRRRTELSYSGPLRRTSDPDEVVDEMERALTRETIVLELAALRALVAERGLDTDTLRMTVRVMQHTAFRARQVRDDLLPRGTASLLAYLETIEDAALCDLEVLLLHLHGLDKLLDAGERDLAESVSLVERLEAVVERRTAQSLAA